MALSIFEVSSIDGPWRRRLAPRRAWIDELPWHRPLGDDALEDQPEALLDARLVWTRTAFSEYASAAAFAEITAALLAAAAPLELIAAAGDFIADEIVHTEAAARLAAALGGAVALEVDLQKLARPALSDDPLLACAEKLVRTSCVGEALTVPILRLSRQLAGTPLVEEVLAQVTRDEGAHGQLGWWFLDWAEPRLDDEARAHLAAVAADALRAFIPLLGGGSGAGCSRSGLGVVACDRYDPALAAAAQSRVLAPLAERGIVVPAEAVAELLQLDLPGERAGRA